MKNKAMAKKNHKIFLSIKITITTTTTATATTLMHNNKLILRMLFLILI